MTYYDESSQYYWGFPLQYQLKHNHTITKYTNKLKPKIVDDVEIPYTEITALDKQVNLIAGHPNRILTDEIV